MSKKKPAKKSPPKDQPFDFKKLCEEILDDIRREIENKYRDNLVAVNQRLDVISDRLGDIEWRSSRVGPIRRLIRGIFSWR